MKYFIFYYLTFITLNAFSQQKEIYSFSAVTESFRVITSPLEFIGDQFYDRAKGLDTCCLFAIGSAKFTVHDKKIDNILLSVGIPQHLSPILQESIQASSSFWEVIAPQKEITFILPVYIFPAIICDRKNYQDSILSSSANMLIYHDEHKINDVKRYNYRHLAKGVETGTILPPLLIKGETTIDVYPARRRN
ncbi:MULTISPECIES: hypothetical protein [unclassified Spirosoma]|uniref:hypothetical protein n=1 Tax=unclassified Spirosoma TaxID=2621999 RepID=UPI000959BF59|nr:MULTISPECIES: hypothetical protein [unclassified Spirosoma]MBN8824769.1 hypothetical protein [Spirosoma sp.]OJW77074.1 MAG: hypothetical protein BGO59_23815 [Spirosoma sp. 48-14]